MSRNFYYPTIENEDIRSVFNQMDKNCNDFLEDNIVELLGGPLKNIDPIIKEEEVNESKLKKKANKNDIVFKSDDHINSCEMQNKAFPAKISLEDSLKEYKFIGENKNDMVFTYNASSFKIEESRDCSRRSGSSSKDIKNKPDIRSLTKCLDSIKINYEELEKEIFQDEDTNIEKKDKPKNNKKKEIVCQNWDEIISSGKNKPKTFNLKRK